MRSVFSRIHIRNLPSLSPPFVIGVQEVWASNEVFEGVLSFSSFYATNSKCIFQFFSFCPVPFEVSARTLSRNENNQSKIDEPAKGIQCFSHTAGQITDCELFFVSFYFSYFLFFSFFFRTYMFYLSTKKRCSEKGVVRWFLVVGYEVCFARDNDTFCWKERLRCFVLASCFLSDFSHWTILIRFGRNKQFNFKTYIHVCVCIVSGKRSVKWSRNSVNDFLVFFSLSFCMINANLFFYCCWCRCRQVVVGNGDNDSGRCSLPC